LETKGKIKGIRQRKNFETLHTGNLEAAGKKGGRVGGKRITMIGSVLDRKVVGMTEKSKSDYRKTVQKGNLVMQGHCAADIK